MLSFSSLTAGASAGPNKGVWDTGVCVSRTSLSSVLLSLMLFERLSVFFFFYLKGLRHVVLNSYDSLNEHFLGLFLSHAFIVSQIKVLKRHNFLSADNFLY